MSNPFSTELTRYLEQQQVPFTLLLQEKPTLTIEETANARGINAKQMVKSILLRDMGGQYALACVPGDQAVDPKKVRSVLTSRRMTCVSLEDVPQITGYQVGTVAPLLLATEMPIVLDPQLLDNNLVTISSGHPMAGIALTPDSLLRLCQPTLASICRDE
ncbi:YbaK/EbsC family protein [Vibrio sp. SCSIO 43135]|uniref:aminoacyl-tRNA deacylase n=1 Tax=Vibrio sp. SCSIO 43135 TaxID=2819096 RepID=UPI0020751D7A|nr:YbaK/EbsC family protein [Vibrio sp. SCSIO 43135]USD40772.1 YbaK/EbsC family protein [Vibrio sp. SCSIO 43135]